MATEVDIKNREGFIIVATYDADNGNDVYNKLTGESKRCIKVALSKNNVIVAGTEKEVCPGKYVSYASGLDADSIVVFNQEVKSSLDLHYIYAE